MQRANLPSSDSDHVTKQMKILVTGAGGFIGSHLCEHLVKQGHTVIGIDNLVSGDRENLEALSPLKDKFTFIKHDVVDVLDIDGLDQIYHLACPASPPHYQAQPIKTLKTCFTGTMNMLELAKKNNARILYTSTSEVYGQPQVHPQTESYLGNVNTIGPRSCYDEGKRIGETLCYEYHNVHNVTTRIARIFNTYGPRLRENDGRVVSNFILQALQSQDITLYGDGSQTRSFCFITDTMGALVKLMNGDEPGPVNIGNNNEITIKQLADEIIALVSKKYGTTSKLVNKPLPKDDPTRRCPDLTKIKATLKWEPVVTLADGLTATIEYFQSRLPTLNGKSCE